MSTELVPYVDPFRSDEALAHLEHAARVFADSGMVPKHFQGKIADCMIALDIAARTQQNPLAVFQSIYFVGGKPGWSAAYLIAQARMRGLRIGWKVEKAGKEVEIERQKWHPTKKGERIKVTAKVPVMRVTAYADIDGERQEVTADTDMAVAEGWTDNEKYSSLCELMLRYRSATMLVRLYMPEILLGLPAVEELETLQVVEEPSPVERVRAQLAEQAPDFTTPAEDDADEPEKVPAEPVETGGDDAAEQVDMGGMP